MAYFLGWGVDGLGIAQSVGAMMEIVILLSILQKRSAGAILDNTFWKALGRMLFATLICGCVTFSMTKFVPLMATDTSLVATIPKFLLITVVSFASYVIASFFLNLDEAKPVINYFKKILFKNVK